MSQVPSGWLHKIHVTVLVKYTVIPLSHSCPLIQSASINIAGDQTQPGFLSVLSDFVVQYVYRVTVTKFCFSYCGFNVEKRWPILLLFTKESWE